MCFGVICLNPFSATALVEFFKTFVLEGFYHLPSVARCATLSSRITPVLSGPALLGPLQALVNGPGTQDAPQAIFL
jgi:hypothetical protein